MSKKIKINLYGTPDYPKREGMTKEEMRKGWKLLESLGDLDGGDDDIFSYPDKKESKTVED